MERSIRTKSRLLSISIYNFTRQTNPLNGGGTPNTPKTGSNNHLLNNFTDQPSFRGETMRIPTRTLLALFALLLASLACGTPVLIETEKISCEFRRDSGNGSAGYYACTCLTQDSPLVFIDLINMQFLTTENLATRVCRAAPNAASQTDAPEAAASPEPTEEPTEEPAPTEPPADTAPLQPYLTGAFTTCDNVARYVNFTIAENAPAYDPATIKVLFNGQAATCTPAASNSKTLTCIYPPAPNGPPAIIEVYNGTERVNEFNFDGGTLCDPVQPPKNNTDPDPTEEPAPTEPPLPEG